MITQEIQTKFTKLIVGMDIPSERTVPNEANFRWFLRNAWIKNQSHKNFREVQNLIKPCI